MKTAIYRPRVQFPQIRKEILSMVAADQAMRKKNLKRRSHWEPDLDRKHAIRLVGIIHEIGWPTVSRVGRRAANGAWLIAQHADYDAVFQKMCLKMMLLVDDLTEVDPSNIARLTDRVLVNARQGQIYGTQYVEKGGRFTVKPIHDPEGVDERRRLMGLPPLRTGLRQMYRKYGKKVPEDL